MQKSVASGFVLAVFVLLAAGVIAAGISEGAVRDAVRDAARNVMNNSNGSIDLSQVRAELKTRFSNKTCDDFSAMKDRVTCKLVKIKLKEAVKAGVPEACRNLEPTKKGKCIALYNAVTKCYEIKGKDKDKCLMKAVGLRARVAIANGANATEIKEKARNYAVVLLEDLELRINNAVENGKISEENATALIAQIVEIKEDVLAGKTKAEIQTKLQTFKDAFRAARTRGEVTDE